MAAGIFSGDRFVYAGSGTSGAAPNHVGGNQRYVHDGNVPGRCLLPGEEKGTLRSSGVRAVSSDLLSGSCKPSSLYWYSRGNWRGIFCQLFLADDFNTLGAVYIASAIFGPWGAVLLRITANVFATAYALGFQEIFKKIAVHFPCRERGVLSRRK